jgi:DNA primase
LKGRTFFLNTKKDTIGQNVSETILTLRWYLVGKIIEEIKSSITSESDNTEPMTMIKDYLGLTLLSQKS